MSTANFTITTRTFPGQHIRHYPGGTRNNDETAIQYLEVKQYTPLDNINPQADDATIIGTCATGFPKELYEPLWDSLLTRCSLQGLRIRSIWCVDKSDHGASGLLNEATQGDDPSFCDLARDILQLVNVFRSEFTSPIVGIGHSMGANALLEVSRLHPRLFSSLVLTDPVMGEAVEGMGVMYTFMSSRRPELWGSREAAEQACKGAKQLKTWDPRVMDLWLKYGIRDTPTLTYPEPGKVTLRMSKAMEVWNYARTHWDPIASNAHDRSEEDLVKYPDIADWKEAFYNPISGTVWRHLPDVQPSVLYLFPGMSPLTTPANVKEKVERTGSGLYGSGGEKYGRAAGEVVKGVSHLAPFEKPDLCAEKTAAWLKKDLDGWRRRSEMEWMGRDTKSVDQLKLSKEWMKQTKAWFESNAGKRRKPKL
jgi:pimeloyl-ACP methyl ester carboxylesterase